MIASFHIGQPCALHLTQWPIDECGSMKVFLLEIKNKIPSHLIGDNPDFWPDLEPAGEW